MSTIKSIDDDMINKAVLGTLASTAEHCFSIPEKWQCRGRD